MKRIVKHPEERRRELIGAALKVLCEKGYEQTSIRDILEIVGGEVGMFYHYFKSKDEVFHYAVEQFLDGFESDFPIPASVGTTSLQEIINGLIALMDQNITKYIDLWSEKLHWSMAAAVHNKMMERMLPQIERLILEAGELGLILEIKKHDAGNTARFLLYGISGVLHEKPLAQLSPEEYREKLRFATETAMQFLSGGVSHGI